MKNLSFFLNLIEEWKFLNKSKEIFQKIVIFGDSNENLMNFFNFLINNNSFSSLVKFKQINLIFRNNKANKLNN